MESLHFIHENLFDTMADASKEERKKKEQKKKKSHIGHKLDT